MSPFDSSRRAWWLLVIAMFGAAVFFAADGDRRPVRPEAPGPEPRETVEEPAPPPPAPDEVKPGWRMMNGIVLDAKTLAPILGARVRFERGDEEYETATDARGEWRHPLPRIHAAWANVSAAGYLPESYDLGVGPWNDLLVTAAPPALLRPATVSISGTVIRFDGAPVADADVRGTLGGEISDVTDAAGRFGPFPSARGEFDLAVFTKDGISWDEEITVPFGARGPIEVTIRLPAPRYVEGRTVDDLGRALPGVLLVNGYGERGPLFASGPDGRFRWPLVTPDTEITAQKPGYVSRETSIPVYAGTSLTVVMERAASITGRVLRADGSAPPGGLKLACDDDACPIGSDGSFRLGPIAASRTRLRIGKLINIDPELSTAEHRKGFEIRLPPLTAVTAHVVDARTGAPVGGAQIGRLITDDRGRCVVHLPPGRSRRVRVEADGYLPHGTVIPRDDPIELRPTRPLPVTVEDPDGRPVPGAILHIPGAPAERLDIAGVTDVDGTVRVHVPAGERFAIRARARGRDPASVPCEADCADLRIVLSLRGARYEIVARNEKGDPLPGAWFEDALGRIAADADGRIAIPANYGVAHVSAPGRERLPIDIGGSFDDDVRDLTLREAAPIRLRFVHPDDSPASGVFVHHERGDASSDAFGRVRFDGYARGESVSIECGFDEGDLPPFFATAGEEERTLRIRGRGEILVQFDAKRGGEAFAFLTRPGEDGDGPDYYQRNEPGLVRLGVREGPVELQFRISPGHFRHYAGLRVRPGETLALDYDFPRAGKITGMVRGPDGKPIEGAGIDLYRDDRCQVGSTFGDGRFRLILHAAHYQHALGEARLVISHYDCAPLLTEPIDLTRDQDLAFRLTLGGRLRGKVLGVPAATTLRILTPAAADDPEAETDDDGTFDFRGPIRAGRHRVEVRPKRGEPFVRDVVIEDGRECVVTFRPD